MLFRLTQLHYTTDHSKDQSLGHAYFNSKYIVSCNGNGWGNIVNAIILQLLYGISIDMLALDLDLFNRSTLNHAHFDCTYIVMFTICQQLRDDELLELPSDSWELPYAL